MKLSKLIGIGGAVLLSLFGGEKLKAEPKLDSAFSFKNNTENNFTMQGERLGIYDNDTFLGGEQQKIDDDGERSTNNYFGARVPLKIGDDKIVADVMASDEQTQNSLGARIRYYYTEDDSIGPVVESLTTENKNSTLAGFQADFNQDKTRFQLGMYQLNSPEGIEFLANSTLVFSAADNLFGLGVKYSEDNQFYIAAVQNEQGDFGYRLRLRYDTENIFTQELVLTSSPLGKGNMYGPVNLRCQSFLMQDIIPEYPDAPVKVAGNNEWFLPVFYTRGVGVELNHTADKAQNTENFKIDSVAYPFANTKGKFQPFIGATWNQDRTGNSTTDSITIGAGIQMGKCRVMYRQEEGSKGEGYGYVMCSEVW